ncbi:uncharacterized protein RCC_03381 [Ramularia collo-cygni]|uniref:Uncharacterized protein n=1 Tax=Ramularia collo-cygni TaxID=112498 RepID=A0A2D3UYV4_9PEZI|nr:uncharacterized protein RCC_03381 [Ramularia collo-cygni]CZT17547.1 uncharacterized protein RCC_03381 [Ramularia collo-cygni]
MAEPPGQPSEVGESVISPDRLSMPLGARLPLALTLASVSGLLLGLTKGSMDAGLVFRAENAHRLPTTQTGWFLYHKSKNYNMMLGGVVEGIKQSIRYSVWVGVFFGMEEGVDRGRAAGRRAWGSVATTRERNERRERMLLGEEEELRDVAVGRDCVSSMLAGLGTAGLFSAWNRFPLATAARTARMGAKAGLAFGLLQDAVGVARGRRIGYIEFVKGLVIGEGEQEKGHQAPA